MEFSRIEILNKELGVGACDIEDIPENVETSMPREQITVIYWYERDWLILNKGNSNYERYKGLLLEYLRMNNKQQKEVKDFSLTMGVTFFEFINKALRIRRKRYKVNLQKIA